MFYVLTMTSTDINTPTPSPTNWVAIWRYIRHELIYVAWAVMEASLLAAFTVGFFRFTRFWSPTYLFIYLLCLILIPFNLSRVMHMVDMPLQRAKNIQLGGLLLAIFFGLRLLLYSGGFILDPRWVLDLGRDFFDLGNPFWWRNIVFTLFITITWWRGLSLTSREVDIDAMGLRIRVGGLFLAPLAVFFAGNFLSLRVTPFILIYFLATLLAVSLTRAEGIAKHQFNQGHAMSVRWFGAILLASTSIVVLATIFGAIAGENTIDVLRNWLGPIWLAFYFGGVTVLRTVLYLSAPLIAIFANIIDYLFGKIQDFLSIIIADDVPTLPIGEQIQGILDELQQEQEITTLQLPPELGRILALICSSVLIILVVYVINRAFRVRRLALSSDGQALGRDELEIGTGAGLRGLLDRLRGYDRNRAAASVRRLYRQMCRTAQHNGFPRAEAQTPYEYLPVLDQVWPDSGDQVRIITNAYVRIRYGELPESQAELNEIKEAWEHLKKTIVTR
jgi:hypothetical protein